MVCEWFYMIYKIHDVVLITVLMTPRCGMLIYIYVLYDDSYEGFHLGFMMRFPPWFYGDSMDVVLRAPLWTNLHNGRILGLLYVMCLRRGCCGWSFNPNNSGQSGDATVSLRGLPRPTPLSSLVHDVF